MDGMSNTPHSELHVGVIGLGGMGTYHARVLNTMAGVTVTALADPPNPALGDRAAELDALVVDDPFQLVEHPEVDAVVIASPDETHASLAIASINAGRPVLCEKPLATTVDDAAAVVAAERSLGRRVLQLGFMREYDEAHRQVVEALGELGPVHHIRCVHTNTHTDPIAVRPLNMIVGQSLVHDIHSVRFLTGAEFESVAAHASAATGGRIRHVLVMARLSNGGHATLEFDDDAFAYHVSVEVTAEGGTVVTGQADEGNDWFARFDQAYRAELSAWADAARGGEATGPSALDGLAAQIVVDAVIESVETAEPVTVDTSRLSSGDRR